jgi:anti-sigma-K factor RskA
MNAVDDDDLLAAELAFGLLDGIERQSAENRLGTDTAFAQAHAHWQAIAAGLFDGSGDAPRPSVWSRIEARLPANDVVPTPTPRSPH